MRGAIRKKDVLVAFLIFLFGCIFVFLIPPFQKNDEVFHYYRAVALSKGGVVCGEDGFSIPKTNYYLPDRLSFGSVLFEKGKFPKSLVLKNDFDFSSQEVVYSKEICNLNFVGYLPNFLGLFVSNFLFNNPIFSFYFGRLFGLLFFIICLFLSFKVIAREYKNVLYVYAFIPMVLHQVSAFSYDVLIYSLIPLMFSLFVNQLKQNNVSFRINVLFVALGTLISLVKLVYFPIILLYFLVNFKSFFSLKKRFLKLIYLLRIFFIYSISSLVLFFWGKFFIRNSLTAYPNLVNPFLQKDLLMNDPLYFLKVYWDTLSSNWEFYFRTFIGVFGWMDCYISNTFLFYLFFVIFVFLIYDLSKSKFNLNIFGLFYIWFVLFATISLIFLSMYLVYTPLAETLVLGVQGRYILVLFPFLIFTLSCLLNKMKVLPSRKSILFVVFFVFVFSVLLKSIFIRYYDYSKNYEDPNVLENVIKNISKNDKTNEILIDKSTSFIIDTKIPDYKVSAFQFYINNQNERILIPYKFQIMDSRCQEEFKHGYLKQTDLQSSGIVLQFFGKLKVKEDKLCIILSPVFVPSDYKTGFLKLKTISNDPMIKFLYLSK